MHGGKHKMFTSEEVTRLNSKKGPNKWFSGSKLGTTGHPVPQSEGKGNTSHREELKVLDVKRKLLFVLSLMTLS